MSEELSLAGRVAILTGGGRGVTGRRFIATCWREDSPEAAAAGW